MNRHKRTLVAAIDIGTTCSSWGFSFKHEYKQDPTKVYVKHWCGLDSFSMKAPTTKLIKPDGKTLDSFGYDAETRYAELAEDGEHREWYFFKRFKKLLFDKICLRQDFTIDDVTGKPLQAKAVFSLVIRYMKEDLTNTLQRRPGGDQCMNESETHWVLTTPAPWNDVTKHFVRKAAEHADIRSENVTIASEPECASLYCRRLQDVRNVLGNLHPGSKYLLLDAGGATVTVTVHEITTDGSHKEIHTATGGDWGGTKVDECFETFLSEIAGESVIDKLKDEAMEDYLDLMRSFEDKKRKTNIDKSRLIIIKIPRALLEQAKEITGQKLETNLSHSRYQSRAKVIGDKLKLDLNVMVGFFDESVKRIISHLDFLFSLPLLEDCQTIIMVGGYSESSVLQEKIKIHFKAKMVFIPDDAELAVLKGAVMFGHTPSMITHRVFRYTYGVKICHKKTTRCNHGETKEFMANGFTYCDNIYDVIARAGDTVSLNKEIGKNIYVPVTPTQKMMLFEMYCTQDRSPVFVTDDNCMKICEISVPIPDTTGGCDRKVGVHFSFGGTEIEVEFNDYESGTKKKAFFEFSE